MAGSVVLPAKKEGNSMVDTFKGVTRIALLVDRSGSMATVWTDAIGAVNAFVEDQRQQDDGRTFLSLFLFDKQAGEPVVQQVCHQVRLNQVPTLTKQNYFPRGGTPLLDAMGEVMLRLEHDAKDGERVLLVVQTDGLENASQEWTLATIRSLVTTHQERHGWTFVFLSAAPDAFLTAKSYGIPVGNVQSYSGDAHGTRSTFATTSSATRRYRATSAGGQSVSNYFGDDEPEEEDHGRATDADQPQQ